MSQKLLQVDRLTTGYRTQTGHMVEVIRNVSLEMHEGETLGLVGESGSGKTTFGMALMGYLRPGGQVMAGTVRFDGVEIFGLGPNELRKLRGKRMAVVPQSASLSLTPTMRVGDQIAEVLTVHVGLSGSELSERLLELLTQVHLPQVAELARRYPHELSGGQLQRVAIAMGLAAAPELLVLDEPTTGLDVTTQAHILDLLRELQEHFGMAMLYISHDIGAIARVSDRLAVMYTGQIVEDGPIAEVFGRPVHPYTRGLLSSVPRISYAGLPRAMAGRPPAPGQHEVGCSFAPRCAFADETCTTIDPTLEPTDQYGKIAHLVHCHHWQRVVASEDFGQMQDLKARTKQAVELEPLIELTEVDITYAKRGLGAFLRRLRGVPEPPATVSDFSLTIHRGETVALVGESGSGKSTIARTIAGLLPPSAGRIRYGEQDLTSAAERRSKEMRRKIQIVFQHPEASLNPRHTTKQILDAPLRLYFKTDREQRLERSASLLEEVRLTPRYLEWYPGQLSGGEKQRVAIARAFAAEPELVLCDEVTSALDVSVQAAVLDLLAELQADRGVSYLFISHNLAIVRAIADRVVVLYQGRMCEVGPVERIYAPPFHPYTETLLAAVPEPVPGARARLLAKDVQEAEPPARGCCFQRRCPRRVGSICDEETPPWRVAVEGHLISCHIPLDELRESQVDLISTSSI
ncbi:MAG: ABC transporter ATP-binding protein [Chloroflexi bacterium]|nr:ABC transporter ATP-binding protein [Chloroflexota bacterium]